MGCQNNTLLRSLTNLSLRGRIRTFHPSAAALLPLFFSFFLFKKKDKYPFFFLCTSSPFSYFFSFSLVCLFLRSSECRSYQFLAADWFLNGLTSANAGEEREMALLEGSPTLPNRVDIVLPNSDPLHSVSVITPVRSAGKSLSL